MIDNTPFPPYIPEEGRHGKPVLHPKFFLENNSSDYSFTMDTIKVFDAASGILFGINPFPFTDYEFDGHPLFETNTCEYHDKTIIIWSNRGVNYGGIDPIGWYFVQIEFSIYDNSGQFITKISSPLIRNHDTDESNVSALYVLDYLTIDYINTTDLDKARSFWDRLFKRDPCDSAGGHFYISTNQ